MKTATLVLAASASLASAQVTFNNETGKYVCAQPGVAYCAGSSLGTDIIIRCDAEGNGQPGRCTDNLAGQPPLGVQPALCYQTSETAGDASCEKNCVVYGSSGNGNGTFTLPADQCTPFYTATSSASTAAPTNGTTTVAPPPQSTFATITQTHNGTVVCPLCTGGTSAGPAPTGTTVTDTAGPTDATKTPVGPTATTGNPTSVPTAGASGLRATAALGLVGFLAAALL